MSKLHRIQLNVHTEDVRRIISIMLDQIMERKTRKRQPIIENMAAELVKENPDPNIITDGLTQLTDTSANEAVQMQELLPLIASLKEDSTPETEVLEYLPNLEEDSLGVGSGSE